MAMTNWLPTLELTWQGKAAYPALLVGAMLVWIGVAEYPAARHCSERPTRITCADLAHVGPGANRHVTLTEFRPAGEDFVYFDDEGGADVFIPACPADPAGVPPDFRKLRVVVRVQSVDSQAEFWKTLAEPELTGVLYPAAECNRLHQARALLTQQYPGIKIDKCRELRIGARVPTLLGCRLLIGWGGVMSLAGLAFLGRDLIRNRHGRKPLVPPPVPLSLRAADYPEEHPCPSCH
jgi:hypothetical protein